MKVWLAVVAMLVLAAGAWAQGQNTSAKQPMAWRVKVGWADMGDFDDGFTAAVDWSLGPWLVTGGWADVSTEIKGADVDGDYWYLEATWTYRPKSNPLWYVGLGPGLYRVDVDVDGDSYKDSSLGGHVVVGTESRDRRWFGELRWVFGTDHDDYDSDGLRAYVGYRF
jgi:hypothetical protein